MKDIVKTVLEHPIATCIVMCAIATLAKSLMGMDTPTPEVTIEE